MPARHEIRSGKDRPKIDASSNAKAPLESALRKYSLGSSEDEDKLYEPDWEITDTDLGPYIDIFRRD